MEDSKSQTVTRPTPRVCVVGSGTRFLSGISYYTNCLTNALAQNNLQTSVILMRQLLPTRLYPGRERVGAALTTMHYGTTTQVFNGVDWFWLPSMPKALSFLKQQRPEVVVFQWWSGTVFHSYLALAMAAKLMGAKVVIEFHEVLDTAEAKIPAARAYVKLVAGRLLDIADGFVVHSEYDRKLLNERYNLDTKPVALIPHGPYRQYEAKINPAKPDCLVDQPFNLLFFGTIRPYKGLEDLIRAFNALSPEDVEKYRLTVVGETWEGWTLPAELIAASPYRERITFVNRYVPDEEVARYYQDADAVVLPYHRSSASGPLHVTMSHGLPVIVTNVGGLVEAAAGYEGALLVPPQNPVAINDAILRVYKMRGKVFADPHSWEHTAERFGELFAMLKQNQSQPAVILPTVEPREVVA
jgi:glycosyltransferase involved in cell wall biosynthesis